MGVPLKPSNKGVPSNKRESHVDFPKQRSTSSSGMCGEPSFAMDWEALRSEKKQPCKGIRCRDLARTLSRCWRRANAACPDLLSPPFGFGPSDGFVGEAQKRLKELWGGGGTFGEKKRAPVPSKPPTSWVVLRSKPSTPGTTSACSQCTNHRRGVGGRRAGVGDLLDCLLACLIVCWCVGDL